MYRSLSSQKFCIRFGSLSCRSEFPRSVKLIVDDWNLSLCLSTSILLSHLSSVLFMLLFSTKVLIRDHIILLSATVWRTGIDHRLDVFMFPNPKVSSDTKMSTEFVCSPKDTLENYNNAHFYVTSVLLSLHGLMVTASKGLMVLSHLLSSLYEAETSNNTAPSEVATESRGGGNEGWEKPHSFLSALKFRLSLDFFVPVLGIVFAVGVIAVVVSMGKKFYKKGGSGGTKFQELRQVQMQGFLEDDDDPFVHEPLSRGNGIH
eukprot:Gb_11514 [translate_table: standard]